MNLPGAVQTRPGSLQECQLGGKAVGGLERGQGFMNRLILMVMVMGVHDGDGDGDSNDSVGDNDDR